MEGKVTEDRDSGKVCQGRPTGSSGLFCMGYNTAPGNLGAGGCEENLLPSKRIGLSPLPRVKQNSSAWKTDKNRKSPLGGWGC